ncbi:MAG: GNAT family N-acetyltransferase [Planctomycetota bacterium]
MSQLVQLSTSHLTEHSDRWDALWHRSECRLPSCLAAGLELWRETFASNNELTALVAADGRSFQAALPLVRSRKGGLRSFQLPADCTVVAGDLLVDPRDEGEAIEQIADGLCSLPDGLLIFEGIEIEAARWQKLIGCLQERGLTLHQSRGHDVGVVDILHDWDAYRSSWSKNHRSAIKRTQNKLNAQGEVSVQRLQAASDAELESALEACFAMEDRSWKGQNGTSILQTPGLRDYYHAEAKLMRDRGLLDLWILRVDNEPIAFEYCHFAKGVCLSHKISFDPAWDRFSPGRLLRALQLQQYHDDPACKELDTLGILCEAKAKWITRRYRSARLFAANGFAPGMAIRGWKSLRAVRDMRRKTEPTSIKCGAARYLESANPSQSSGSLPSLAAPTPQLSPSALAHLDR